ANLTGTPPTGPGDACFTPIASTNFNLFAPDGSKTIAVWFRDGANNVSTSPALDSITLDTAAPTLSVMGPGLGIAAGAAGTNSLMPVFSHTASDGVSGLSQVCTGTTSPPMNCVAYTLTPTLSLTAGDGMKTGFIRVIDGAGNPSAILSDTITLDQTAPMLSMVNVNGGAAWTNSINVSVSSTASDAIGVAQLQLSNTGPGGYATAITYVTPTPHTLSTGDGMKTVTMRVLDSAGNPSTDVQDSIGLDTTPPTATISINTGASYTATASVSVGWTPVETGSGLSQLCLKETAVGAAAPATPTAADPCFVAYATPAMFSLTAQGNRRLYGWLLDLAGNVSIAAATDDIFFDSVVPTVPTGPAATAGHRLVTLTFTNATDAASGVQGYELGTSLVTGGPYVFGSIVMPQVGMTTSVPLTLPNGVQQFLVVRTVDNAGNRSANSTQVTATPRWPFSSQNRPASGAQVRDLAFHTGTSRYFTAGANGALYSSDLTLSTFTRRDPMTDQTLNGLLIDSAGDVWTVGRQGHISRSTDDGVTFEVLPNADTSMPQRDLNQLTFAGTTGSILVTSWWVAVGNAGRIVRAGTSTLNNAPSFSVITTSTSANLNSVTRCASASGPCSTGGVLIAVGTVGTVLRSTDNGATWTSVTLPAGYTTTLNAVAALPNSNTVFIGAVSPAGQGALLRSVDGGQAFVELSGFGDLTEITALSALGADLWATGRIGTTAATLRLTGNTRTDATLPAPLTQNVTQVGLFARTATDVVSGGSNGDMMQMTGALTFTKKNLGVTTSFINKMSMPPTFGSTAWAVGGGGLILFTSNAGTTWTQQAAGLTPNTITSVEAFDTGGGVAATLLFGVGAGGQIYKSTNGGTTWAFDPDNGIVAASLTDVACRTATSCLAVGSASTVLTWSGSNWVVTSTGGPRVFNAVAAYVSSGVNRAVVVGNGGALQTQSGTTWTTRPDINAAVDFRGLAAKNDSTGVLIAVGTTGAIYKSIDHGATFTVRTSGVTATLEDVSHVVGTSVWYASGGVGTLVKSIDDGETWTPLVTNSTDNLLAVCTGSIASRVWVGGNGTALLFSPTAGQ
ncbi:MAG: hypothetical protein JNM17_35335, partial [Archangium sp.]|nr:hypothetical protein [Archangium sp.]